ncbi:MAG TPA: hypothetical protein VKD66_10320 [Streptosporangiaceae bacterium]|nr:hypothetical protein [Streptosporangiaceae bacterium]
MPVGQRQGARVVELVFGALVITLSTDDAGGISVHDPVSDRLFHDADQRRQAVLHHGAARPPAGWRRLAGNRIRNNTKACAAGEDIPFPLSGVGVALLGATGMKITGNLITGNVPSADTEFSAGILVASGPGNPATAPADNRIHGNRILRNDPDLFWDQTGSGNSFRGNFCRTSTPAGLCHHA